MIQQEAIIDNLNTALEYSPEVFGTVTMLFVDVLVNGHKVKAFVDSGAQSTIMTPECVERCNMTHLVDKRFQGIARGVGTAKILGRIHSAPVRVGNNFLPCSFTVVEDKHIDMLLGLDMLKRHQGCIDLKRNVLEFGGGEIPFLPESEIPNSFEGQNEENVPPPSSSSGTAQRFQELSNATSQVATSSSNSSSFRPANRIADAQPHPSSSYSEETILNLMNLGFSRDEVIRVLDKAGGNPELAAALLFQ
jgi:DNA damage-inducible protein 1